MIDKIERLVLENVMGNDAVQTGTTSRVLKKKKNNRLENESESLLKIIKLLSVQQIKYLSNQRQHRKIYCS